MENASKALIIAGAILLAIVIISLGLIVVNNARSQVDNSNLSEQEVQAFNAKFISYEGSNVSGTRVNTLIQQVIATNQATADAGKDNFIGIGFPTSSGTNNASKPYVVIGYNNGIKRYGTQYTAISAVNGISGGVTVKSRMEETQGSTDGISLSVSTGADYKVELGYDKGLVKYIAVTK